MSLTEAQQETLMRHIEASTSAARQMFAVLQEEFESLHQREIPTPELLTRKAENAELLARHQSELEAFRQSLPAAPSLKTWLDNQTPGNATDLKWRALQSTLEQCDYKNEVNGRLLNKLRVKNQLFQRLLGNQPSDPTYSRKGKLDDSHHGVLGRA